MHRIPQPLLRQTPIGKRSTCIHRRAVCAMSPLGHSLPRQFAVGAVDVPPKADTARRAQTLDLTPCWSFSQTRRMTMQDSESSSPTASKRTPWNKGKLTGAKPPLRPKHVWSIRSKLQMADRKRDLALFNLAIDSKLRGCDVVALRADSLQFDPYPVFLK